MQRRSTRLEQVAASGPADRTIGVSVVMTTFDAERYVVPSSRSVLDQVHQSFELVIQDDGSRDSTVELVRSLEDPRVRLIASERTGRAAALNSAIRASRGGIVAINDADDISLPFRLAVIEECLERNPDVVLVGTVALNTRTFPPASSLVTSARPPSGELPAKEVDHLQLYRRNPFVHSTVAFRRSAWDRIGGYDEQLPMCVDYDLFLRLAGLGRVLMVEYPTVVHYEHPDSYFKRRGASEYLRVLRRIRTRARRGLRIPAWARLFDVIPYLQATRAVLVRP